MTHHRKSGWAELMPLPVNAIKVEASRRIPTAEAVERIAASAPDVLILDLHLRDGSGFGVLRSLERAGARRPKVIILAGFDLPQYRREAETLGVDAFLNKSRDYHRLPVLLSGYASQHGPTRTH